MHLSAGELRAVAQLLDRLDEFDGQAGSGDDWALIGDVPIHVGDTHMLVGHAENADGEGHILRVHQEKR